MRHWILLVCLLAFTPWAASSSQLFSAGDQVFVQARVVGCGDEIRNVDVAEVSESGNAVFFGDITIEVLSNTPEHVAKLITDALEERVGYRPQTIRVVNVPKDNDKQSALMMLEIYELRRSGCRVKPWRDWQQPINDDGSGRIANASHNKSLKADALQGAA